VLGLIVLTYLAIVELIKGLVLRRLLQPKPSWSSVPARL
jgi:hypothetical protein